MLELMNEAYEKSWNTPFPVLSAINRRFRVTMPAPLPVLLAVLTPIGFAANALYSYYMSNIRLFETKRMQIFGSLIMNAITCIFAVILWHLKSESWYLAFKWDLFYWGFAGSIMNNLGMISHHMSMSLGPVGPINVFVGVSNIILPIAECIYYGM